MKFLFLLLTFFTLQILSHPSKPEYISRSFSSSDGLAHNIVSSILQDKKGFLWIGTYGGLNRFDGKEFRNYTMVDGLVFDSVRSLYLHEDGKIWIGTELGLSIAQDGEILSGEVAAKYTKPFIGKHIRTFGTIGKLILVGTTSGLFAIRDSTVEELKNFKGQSILNMQKISNGLLFIGTKDIGLHILNENLEEKAVGPDEEVLSIAEDEENSQVLVSYKKMGILAYDREGNSKNLESFKWNKKFDPKGRYLICKNSLDKKFVFLSQIKKSYFYSGDHYEEYNTENGNTCFVDNEGDIWIGTYGSGLIEFFKRKAVSFSSSDGITDPGIRYIFKDSRKILWLGTQNNLAKLDNNKFHTFSKEEISMDRVRSILQDSKGRVWFGTGSGLFYFDKKFTQLKSKKGESLDVYSLDELEGFLFVLEGGKRVKKISLNPVKSSKSIPIQTGEYPEVFWKLVTSIDKKDLYLQSSERILKYDKDKDKFVTLKHKSELLNLKKIQAFLPISNEYFIVGYDKLVIYKNGELRERTVRDGLPNGQIVSFAFDKDESIWIGTSKGLAKFDEKDISSYTTSDGLAGDFCHFNSIFLDEENVYVGTSEGLSIIKKESIQKNPIIPQVYFTKIKTNKETVYRKFSNIELDYDENTIQLSAASLSLVSPHRNEYKFTKFYNDIWEESEKEELNSITYYNLEPGKYTFRVLGTNNEGKFSSSSDEITIIIRQAFWQTWYFQIGVIAIALAVGYGIYSLRVYRIKQENAKLDQLVKIRTQELSEEKEVSERLLLNILPKNIASRLKNGESNIADSFVEVTVLFADLVGFTKLSQTVTPRELVAKLNDLFSRFDKISLELKVEKIKTIGDCYMAVAGLPELQPNHAELIMELAKRILNAIDAFNKENEMHLSARIGINTGEVVAGVIGQHKFIYDLWGDAVNTASRMESHGIPGKIHLTQSTYEKLKDKYSFESRGLLEIKGKGTMETYLYSSPPEIPILLD